jgi:hypothetical protein
MGVEECRGLAQRRTAKSGCTRLPRRFIGVVRCTQRPRIEIPQPANSPGAAPRNSRSTPVMRAAMVDFHTRGFGW